MKNVVKIVGTFEPIMQFMKKDEKPDTLAVSTITNLEELLLRTRVDMYYNIKRGKQFGENMHLKLGLIVKEGQ